MSAIDEYMDTLSVPQRKELERIRSIVKTHVPEAEETISYNLPSFKVNDKPLVYFGAFKNHLSLFPTSRPIAVLKDQLEGFTFSKGAINFTIQKPLPEKLIIEILRVRLSDIDK